MEILPLFDVQSLLITAFAVLSTSLAVSFVTGSKRRNKYPPGPHSWPILGSLPYIIRLRLNPLQLLVRIAQQYGDIAHLRLFGYDVIVLSDANIVKEAYNQTEFSGRPRAIYHTVAGRSNFGLISSSGDVTREQRQLTLNFFRTFGVGKSCFEEKITAEAGYLIAEFHKKESQPFDPKKMINNAVSNIICSVVFGSRHDYTDPVFNAILESVNSNLRISKSGGIFFFMEKLAAIPRSPGNHIRQNVTCIIQQIKTFVDDHLPDYQPDHPRDMIDLYLDKIKVAPKNGTVSSYDDINMLFTLADTFSGGSETTTTVLRWLLLHMIASPEIQRKVQEEIDLVVGQSRMPALSDRPDMPYTEATIFETLRFDCTVPLGVPHQYSKPGGGSFHDYHIPDGALVVVNGWKMSRDPQLWDDPDVFKPERFLNEEGKFVKPDHMMPFSTGKRLCIGEGLAKMELFLVFTHLLHRFSFTLPDGVASSSLVGEFGAVYTPKPFQLCAIARE